MLRGVGAEARRTAQRFKQLAEKEIHYVVDLPRSVASGLVTLEVASRSRLKSGEWGQLRPASLSPEEVPHLRDPLDRQLLAVLKGSAEVEAYRWTPYSFRASSRSIYSPPIPVLVTILPELCRSGRAWLRVRRGDEIPLAWDDGGPWHVWLLVKRVSGGSTYRMEGSLRRGDQQMDLSTPFLVAEGGLMFLPGHAALYEDKAVWPWMILLRNHLSPAVPVAQKDQFLAELLAEPHLPRLDLPEELHYQELSLTPRPRLTVRAARKEGGDPGRLRCELTFDYGGTLVSGDSPGDGIFQPSPPRRLQRDRAFEAASRQTLLRLGFRSFSYRQGTPELKLAPRKLARAVQDLVAAGWHVEAEGKLYRQAQGLQMEVRSGIDWFELHGAAEFDGQSVEFPQILSALKRGEEWVTLGDGTLGMLPPDWLKKYGLLARLGTASGGCLKFKRSQVGLLDAVLASQPQVAVDEVFSKARDSLRRFAGVHPADPGPGFIGQLRPYQREGLGWLRFLPDFGFGGCLADDMGLGKTVQVLALLESRRELRREPVAGGAGGQPLPPSLVVVPRSLVFNWKQEAARFTPRLKVLDHTGIHRARDEELFQEHDVVLTTYGTLRRDALWFAGLEFDYAILDEAQAIKNAATESSKAVRLLRARHRLALSGTPVENHLGELWSLFEFLNPGMLGAASVFSLNGSGPSLDDETRRIVSQALRPFILRRTKEQVAPDLPPKLEQTLYCELEPAQRKLYDELREHYRRSILAKVDSRGLSGSKIQILEALLRLRQAALHPALIDRSRGSEPSAKLDILLPQLLEVIEEGHKALVFSQFTRMLALLRPALDEKGISYEYLDGRTQDRGAKVERFQADPACKLFLISLKAGGLGLNLTAADYVFLLDPWWNPAVEAQAIDRAHRIGQSRQVFAYRLIARDTVEEKVLELQKTKRALADAIITAENSLIGSLKQEDLELLLS
jgi:superfamily II DNA or RNA helicase